MNLVAGQTIEGRMTLRVVDVPWDEALDLVLSINGLGKRRTGSVLLVAPAAALVEQERLELEHRKARAELAPLTRTFIRLRYADAATLANLVGDGAVLSERGRVLVDPRTNSLVVTDTAANLAELRSVIEQLDGPVRQVQIEARVVNVNDNFSEELGIHFGGAVFTPSPIPHIDDEQAGDNGNRRAEHVAAHLGIAGDGASSITVGIADARYQLDLQLSAMAADGRAEIVARPSVITADKRLATI
ncbi:MAG: secretin and TonB N-terminal domain-containing protein, partial [Gammaproteobacteria bacterium]|nr:secretin and TonB N-terminal domain-containing protein [Gammaproteobacteria bacterium]